MAKVMLRELTEGMTVKTLAVLKSKRLVPYKNKQGAFLALTLTDRSGGVEAKVFDGAEELAPHLSEGQVIQVTGRASSYQGTMGVVLEAANPWDGPIDPEDFLPTYTGDVPSLVAALDGLVASLLEPNLRVLLQSLFSDPEIRERYCLAPAAKGMHGAYLHGLLEHVTRQARLAEVACECYPTANRDLVIAGVLLHDIGKIFEFRWDLSIDYTVLGRLEGHCVIGDRLVYERGRELDIAEDIALQLRHLILSHHGEPAYGAAVIPQTLEALILHHVDHLEADATHCLEMLAGGDAASEWTDYDRMRERFWYRGRTTTALPTEV
jgi:3'-5' exoribonuclease